MQKYAGLLMRTGQDHHSELVTGLQSFLRERDSLASRRMGTVHNREKSQFQMHRGWRLLPGEAGRGLTRSGVSPMIG